VQASSPASRREGSAEDRYSSHCRRIDCLLAEIAVIDPSGAIISTNRKWKETARAGELLPWEPNWNYIAECVPQHC
jgi:hypothetical protein